MQWVTRASRVAGVPGVEEVVVERVAAAAGQPHLGHVAADRERHLELDHRHRHRVAGRADQPFDRVRHVALVVRRVQVDAVPAARRLVADVELAAGRAVRREVPVVVALAALQALDRAG